MSRFLAFFALAALAAPALAEDDGDEFLALMDRPAARDIVMEHLGDVRARLDGGVFCVVKGNPQPPADPPAAMFAAVKSWLEAHPGERYRPRRYLMTQALRAAFACPPR